MSDIPVKNHDNSPRTGAWASMLRGWTWVPTLYFIQGLPNVTVVTLAVILYKKMGISNTEIAYYTGWLYLPWVLKFIWSPFVDLLRSKRWWTVTMQLLLGCAYAAIAFLLPASSFFSSTLAVFALMSFFSATHDIASDGFYMLALDQKMQSFFVGIRCMFYRFSTIFVQGIIVVIAAILEEKKGDVVTAWKVVFLIMSGIFLVFTLYHLFVLPRPSDDRTRKKVSARDIFREFGQTISTFFRKDGVWTAVIFLLLYRLPEAQLVKMINPFLLDSPDVGGLGLSTKQVGITYGTNGVIGLIVGGILGGIAASIGGLKRWIKPMAWAMSLTCITFIILSQVESPSFAVINICVFIEQLGYGFGFSAYMLYMLYFSEGRYATSHYAFCTVFMALSIMLPGMAAGWIQEHLGYANFFIWTFVCCIATIVVAMIVRIDGDFGKKAKRQ